MTEQKQPHDIRIEPWPPTRGRKSILVDGAKWGSVHMETHGVHGPTYNFVQDGAPGYIMEPGANGRFHVISVRATNKRRRPGDEPPIEQLVFNKVHQLVAEGRLRDPVAAKADTDRRLAEAEAVRQRVAEKEQSEFEERADQAIQSASDETTGGLLEFINDQQRMILRDAIVAAMRWAQTK
jgi:hypothetical protein